MINILIVAHEKNIRRTPGESLRECHLESAVYERGAGVGHQVQLGEETARGGYCRKRTRQVHARSDGLASFISANCVSCMPR